MSSIDPFVPVQQLPWTGDRRYQCIECGWLTEVVRDGSELKKQIETHRQDSPSCFPTEVR